MAVDASDFGSDSQVRVCYIIIINMTNIFRSTPTYEKTDRQF